MSIHKVDGDKNPADLQTKHLPVEKHKVLCKENGLRFGKQSGVWENPHFHDEENGPMDKELMEVDEDSVMVVNNEDIVKNPKEMEIEKINKIKDLDEDDVVEINSIEEDLLETSVVKVADLTEKIVETRYVSLERRVNENGQDYYIVAIGLMIFVVHLLIMMIQAIDMTLKVMKWMKRCCGTRLASPGGVSEKTVEKVNVEKGTQSRRTYKRQYAIPKDAELGEKEHGVCNQSGLWVNER